MSMTNTNDRRLAELLVQSGLVSQSDIDRAFNQQAETGISVGRILITDGIVSEIELASTLGEALKVPFVPLMSYDIDEDIIRLVPENIVRKYKVLPIDKDSEALTVALSDPNDLYVLDELRLRLKTQIRSVISFESDIAEAINRYFGNSTDDDLMSEIEDEQPLSEMSILDDVDPADDDEEIDTESGPIIQLVNMIIGEAVKMRASDIHVEPYEKDLRLRYRVDGKCIEGKNPPKKFQSAIISRIKIMSNLDIAEKRVPQDGRFKLEANGKKIDFRVSSCPTIHGEKIVMRLLDSSNLMLNLTDLGMSPQVMATFERNIRAPWGMVLVTGPTGSGKSTTLYSALSTINAPDANIMTAEDPVEYQLRGINQVAVRGDIGLTFAAALKSFLRQDPDIIMVGEIRDLETAEVAVKAALTGHLVLSTLHTNDAPSTINRLTNMGVEPFLVTASVNMIVAQRLVRRVCSMCKELFDPLPEVLEAYNVDSGTQFARGDGCAKCNNLGYKGRAAIYEVMEVSDMMREKIIEGISSTALKRFALDDGMQSLRGAGIDKVVNHVTTLDEVLAVTTSDER